MNKQLKVEIENGYKNVIDVDSMKESSQSNSDHEEYEELDRLEI